MPKTARTAHTDWIRSELDHLRSRALFREIPCVDRGADLRLQVNGTPLLNLASNNYLGLAGNIAMIQAAKHALDEYGTSSSASRLVTGNSAPYDILDQKIAEFKSTESALALGSGFTANLAIFAALCDRRTVVFSDRLNHASIIDGIQLSGAKHVRYRHNDMDHLRSCLKKHHDAPRKILATDTVFSMDGDVAELARIAALCKEFGVFSVVDEAHATGVFGTDNSTGQGMTSELGLMNEIDLHMGTFSKGLGSYGAYVAGKKDTIDLIRNKGRSFIYSTALPPAVVAANLAALELAKDPALAARLRAYSDEMRTFLNDLGFDIMGSTTQIIPVLIGDNDDALRAKEFLMKLGVYVAAIRPPTVPDGTARLRISMRADLTPEDIALIKTGFTELAGEILS